MDQNWEELNTPISPPTQGYRSSLRKRSLGVVLSLLVCGFIFVAGSILAFYFLPNPDLLFGEKRSAGSADKLIQVEFSGDEFVMPEPVVRSIERSLTGKVRRIELRVPWPYSNEAVAQIEAEDLNKITRSLFLTFEHNIKRLPALTHLNKVLKRYFDGGPTSTESGLTRYQFKANSPYPESELYLAALRGKQFIIQCGPKGGKNGPSLCERDLQINKALLARYRFHRKYLGEWRQLEAKAQELFATFRIPAAR
jgi:hypothetical protein